jgi:hypothetical protein
MIHHVLVMRRFHVRIFAKCRTFDARGDGSEQSLQRQKSPLPTRQAQ